MNKTDKPEIKKGDCVRLKLKGVDYKLTVWQVTPEGIFCLERKHKKGAVRHSIPYQPQSLELVDSRDESDDKPLEVGDRVYLPSDPECPMEVSAVNEKEVSAFWITSEGQVGMSVPHGVFWRWKEEWDSTPPIVVVPMD